MGSVSPLLVYSPRAKNDFNFMTSHTDWPSDMYLVGVCECVSFMQNNPDVCVLEDSPVDSRFRVHELKRDFAGYHSIRLLPVPLDKFFAVGGFRVFYRVFHTGNKYAGFSSYSADFSSLAAAVDSYLKSHSLSDITDIPFIFHIESLAFNYHNSALYTSLDDLFASDVLLDSGVKSRLLEIRGSLGGDYANT